MPSHKIHLAIAKKVNDKLNLDLDSIMLGSVLPDLTIYKDHRTSHYQIDGTYEERLANPDKFVKEYKNKLNNPVMIGYLIHLLTDRYYNDYFFKNHCIIDENKLKGVKLKNGKVKKQVTKYKHKDFIKYDFWLLKNKYVYKFNSYNCISNVKNLSVASFDKNYLKEYIKKANEEVDNPRLYKIRKHIFYKVLSKEELDKMFNECCNYIIDYIKNIKKRY